VSEISRTALFGKLNSVGYKSMESATVFCKMRGNPYVELVHWLNQILQLEDSDLHRIIKQFNVNPSRLVKDVTDSLEKLPRGSTSISDLSSHLEEAVERGWVYGSLMFGESQIRTGHLIVGMLKTRGLTHALNAVSGEFEKIKLDTLTDRFDEVVAGSPEASLSATDGFQSGGGAAPGEASGAMPPAALGKQEALKQFTADRRPRRRDPPDHRHPDAAAAEQPDPDR
jgi:type VI secretion system protein VasG